MQQSNRQPAGRPVLRNPVLDLAIVGLEAQLRAWQIFQVEGTRFIAKRLTANLELLRTLGHCSDSFAMGECQRAWLTELRKDYAEEWGRIIGDSFAVALADVAPALCLFGSHMHGRTSEPSSNLQAKLVREAA